MDTRELYLAVMENREKIDLSLQGIEQFELLVTAYSSCGDGFANAIGYCLQIREGSGEVGADNQVFLRHADGTIRVHHQQAFYRVNDDFRQSVLALFTVKPEDEDQQQELTCPNGITETGFRVALREDCYQ